MIARLVRTLRNNILVGLLLITPIALTLLVVRWLFTWFTGLFLDFVPEPVWKTQYEFIFRIAAFIAVLILLFFIGLLVRNIIGKRLYHLGDMLLVRIPVVNKIYVWIRQIIETLLAQRQSLFNEVVLLEYPRAGVFALGFVTAVVPDETAALLATAGKGEHLSVFIPTTPNPTSGWFCIVPRSQTIPVKMSPGEAMKLIISGGAVFPGTEMPHDKATLLERLDQWFTAAEKAGKAR